MDYVEEDMFEGRRIKFTRSRVWLKENVQFASIRGLVLSNLGGMKSKVIITIGNMMF